MTGCFGTPYPATLPGACTHVSQHHIKTFIIWSYVHHYNAHACMHALICGCKHPPPLPCSLSLWHIPWSPARHAPASIRLSQTARAYTYTHIRRERHNTSNTYARQRAALFQRTSICVHLSCSLLLSLALSCSLLLSLSMCVCLSLCRAPWYICLFIHSHTYRKGLHLLPEGRVIVVLLFELGILSLQLLMKLLLLWLLL